MSSNYVCVTLARYNSLQNKIWAFYMMQKAHAYLRGSRGLQFYKLMGSGKGNGFNPYPDWSRYALLTVWENQDDMDSFIASHALVEAYKKHTGSLVHLKLRSIHTHGLWSGIEPFKVHKEIEVKETPVAVITRATIRLSKLRKFWKYVPTASTPIDAAEGLIYTKGIGEVPVIQMATLSVWENIDKMKKYAYNSEEHREAIFLTRKYDWYKEELFARFVVDEIVGNLTDFKFD